MGRKAKAALSQAAKLVAARAAFEQGKQPTVGDMKALIKEVVFVRKWATTITSVSPKQALTEEWTTLKGLLGASVTTSELDVWPLWAELRVPTAAEATARETAGLGGVAAEDLAEEVGGGSQAYRAEMAELDNEGDGREFFQDDEGEEIRVLFDGEEDEEDWENEEEGEQEGGPWVAGEDEDDFMDLLDDDELDDEENFQEI